MTLMSLKIKQDLNSCKKRNFKKLAQILLLLILFQISFQIDTDINNSIRKISKVNILLPVCPKTNCNEVYVKLIAYNGCYEWKAEDPSLIQIQQIQKPEDNKNCFSEAYIYTKSKSIKDITYVTAKDKRTNEYFKCKVGFAEVSRISIEKSFDTINVGDIFELHVLAYDDKGNIFSSLEGWKFNWKILSGHNNAQLIKFIDHGKVEIGEKREKIEKSGHHSDIILIKGSQTGKILVSVDILEDELKNQVISDKRELYIIEPFKIIPDNELYIIPYSQYNFDLMYTHSKKIIPRSEHRYFKWSVTDEKCGKIKSFGNFYSNGIGCNLKVIAQDTRLEKFNTDEVIVHVLFPNSIDIGYMEINENDKELMDKVQIENKLLNFNLSPTFKLVEGKHYIIKNFLMYDDQPVYYNYNKVNFNFDLSELKNFVYKNKINYKNNNEFATLTAEKVTKEEKVIQSSISIEKNNPLVIKKNVIIYEKVRIKKFNMPYFTLPYLGYSSNQNNREILYGQELYLIVTGGTGNYLYTSSNSEIVDIIQDSYLISRNRGKANIIVTDKEINANNDNIDIYVKDINSFTFMEERQEILIGNNFEVTPVALQQNKKYELQNIFTNCSNIKLSYKKSDNDLAQTQEDNFKQINRYSKIKHYINRNIHALNEKLSLIKIKNNTDEYDYMEYSNYGICGIDSFVAINEGLIKLFYESVMNIKDKFSDNININTINSINPANVYIYSQMEIKNIFSDNFTKYIIEKNKLENPDMEKTFVIAEGSGIELQLKGGIIPWTGYQNDYIEDKLVVESNDKSYNADKVSKYIKFINKKEKIIYAYCNRKGYEFEFVINIHNKRDLSLINPGESKVRFRISCQNPDHLSMYLLSQTNNFLKTDDFILNEIFNQPQKKGIEYFVKKNSSDIVRVYAFDKDKRIFANITSLKGDFEKNRKNKNYFKIIEKDKVLNEPSSYIKDKEIIQNIYTVDNQEFLQDYILFNDNDENSNQNKFELKYNLKNNINNQNIYLQMIDVPEIYPKNASVYVRENNIYPLSILKGSGDFSIQLNDEDLAKYNYDKNNRKLYITPLKKGILIIRVIDNQLGTGFNYEAKSTLYLSDISRILVYGGGLLMNNKSTILGIEVFDNFENKFSEDQQKIMPLRLNESFYGLDYSFTNDNTKLNVTGLNQGLYPIIIKDDISEVFSNIATIEVFDKLQVYPPYLLLVPGSSYTLSVTGGPKNKENVIIKYEIQDEKIANVTENYPNVYGKVYGETKLKISLLYKYDYNKIYNINDDKHIINKTDLLCVENVPIRVDFPDTVEIIGAENNRKIYSKSTIRLLAALKKGGEVFTYGVGPFIFNWNVDNNIVAKIKYFMKKSLYLKENENKIEKNDKDKEYDENCEECESLSLISTKEDHNPQNSIGVFLSTYEEGIVTISLLVTISYPSPYTMHKPYKFSTTSKIIVNDQLSVDLPGFYGEEVKKTGLYLLPYNVDHELHTNKNSEQLYSIIRQHDINDINNKNAKIISMTDSGRVTTYTRNGLAYVSISQQSNKDNNVPVILPILVNDFYSIFIEKTHTIIDMEVGQDILLKVIIQHYHGLSFAEKFERLPLKAVVSHPNIANVELIEFNSKLRLKAQNVGETNIILFHPETRKIYDVFKLNVVKQTTLLNKIIIPIGGTINFFGKDINKKKELMNNAEWISDNNKIMKIDKNGLGTALNEGEATIMLKEKNSQKILTSTRVLVKKINRVSFDKTKLPKSFSDIKKSGETFISKYQIPVILYTNEDEIFTNDENDKLSIINPKIKIKCESDSPDFVKADELNKDNMNECIFTIRENKFGDNKKGWGKNEEKPKDISIQLTVEDYNRKKNSVQENVPFSSSFKIKNNVHTINLSYKEREYYIYVDNLNDLDIKISNEKLVKIEEINKEKKYIKIKIPYSVDDDFRGVILYLANVLTGQKEEIIINYNNSGTNVGAGSSVNSATDFFFVIILTCLLLFIGYFLIFSGRKTPNLSMGNMNMNYNNQNYYNGRGYPTNDGNNFIRNNNFNNYNNNGYNINNNINNNVTQFGYTNNAAESNYFDNNNYNNNYNFKNKGGFNNMMGSSYHYSSPPRGSIFNKQYFRSNIDMNGPYN